MLLLWLLDAEEDEDEASVEDGLVRAMVTVGAAPCIGGGGDGSASVWLLDAKEDEDEAEASVEDGSVRAMVAMRRK